MSRILENKNIHERYAEGVFRGEFLGMEGFSGASSEKGGVFRGEFL